MDEEYELEDIDFFHDKPEQTEQTPNKHCKGVDYINTTKVSTALVLPEAKEKSVKVHEYGIKSRKNKEKYTVMSLYSRILNMSDVNITHFDLCVLDSVYTMSQNGQTEFTIEQLANSLMKREVKYRDGEMNFQDTFDAMKIDSQLNPELSEEELSFYNRLHLSMFKLTSVMVRLDCSKMSAPDGGKMFDRHIRYGVLQPLIIDEYESPVKKERRIRYKVVGKSLLYEYAERLNRIAIVPAKMLDTGLPATVDSAILGKEIATIIALMKNPHNHYASRDITYEWKRGGEEKGLFTRIGLNKNQYSTPQSWSKKKAKIHLEIGKILEKYKRDGTIKDYHENIQGRSKVGYHIDL